MVRKSDINRLFKQKHFTGHQVGRLLLETLLDQLYHRPQRISDEEIAHYYRPHNYIGTWGYNLKQKKSFDDNYSC